MGNYFLDRQYNADPDSTIERIADTDPNPRKFIIWFRSL